MEIEYQNILNIEFEYYSFFLTLNGTFYLLVVFVIFCLLYFFIL